MYKELCNHKEFVKKELGKNLSAQEKRRLYEYHIDRVHDFQHERLIHLLVTFFFAFLLIGSVVALTVQPLAELRWPLGLLSGILLILELAYIRHYYQLENGVQSLYSLTEDLRSK